MLTDDQKAFFLSQPFGRQMDFVKLSRLEENSKEYWMAVIFLLNYYKSYEYRLVLETLEALRTTPITHEYCIIDQSDILQKEMKWEVTY